MKTVRFARVVEACGRPHVHALWTAPAKDPEFARALAAHRVMTLDHTAGKADAGTIGFAARAAKGGEFLIFPKSLRRFAGARVVGVKYELIAQPQLAPGDIRAWMAPAPARRVRPPPAKHPDSSSRDAAPASHPAPAAHDTPAPRPTRRAPSGPRASRLKPETTASPSDLVAEVRAALAELERGKTVAAYRRLQRAVGG